MILSSLLDRFSEPETLKMAKLGRELRAQGIDVIDLSLGEPDFDTPQHIKDAAIKAINDNWSHYTPVAGFADLREAVCSKLKRDNQLDYKPENIVTSTGAKQSLANAILALVDDGDEVIIPTPYWVTYSELVKIAHEYKTVFHSDAVQAVGCLEVHFQNTDLDAMTVSGHKVGGPQGIGALVVKRDIELTPLLHGGGQERDVRSGTLAAPSIAGFAAATIVFGLLIAGIDNAAHIGGFLAGILSGLALLRPLDATHYLPRRSRLLACTALTLAIAVLISLIPAPAYRWSEEALARKEIGRFLRDDVAIREAWRHILEDNKRGGISFDELAGRIDTSIADRYEASFEQLSRLGRNPALPSSATIETLRHYAGQRRDASRSLAEGLRAHDQAQIREALEHTK